MNSKEEKGLAKISLNDAYNFIKTHYTRLTLAEILSRIDFLSFPEDRWMTKGTIDMYIDYYNRVVDEDEEKKYLEETEV